MQNLTAKPNLTSPSSHVAGSTSDSTEELSARFVALIENAESRIRLMKNKADAEFSRREERLVNFVAVQSRLDAIIGERLGVLTQQDIFSDARIDHREEIGSNVGMRSNDSVTTVTLPVSAERHKEMKFSFLVFPSTDVDNAIVEFRMQIVPVFTRFVDCDQFTISITAEDDQAVVDWVDGKLVGFAETYFDVFFHPEYQKTSLVTDPVLGIQFPKSMATAAREADGATIYFFTEKSSRLFDENPSFYLGHNIGSA